MISCDYDSCFEYAVKLCTTTQMRMSNYYGGLYEGWEQSHHFMYVRNLIVIFMKFLIVDYFDQNRSRTMCDSRICEEST